MNRKSFLSLLLGAFAIPRSLFATKPAVDPRVLFNVQDVKFDPDAGWRDYFIEGLKKEIVRLRKQGVSLLHKGYSQGVPPPGLRLALPKECIEYIEAGIIEETGFHKTGNGLRENTKNFFGYKPWFDAQKFGLVVVPDARLLPFL
jgi:hypothetical protein